MASDDESAAQYFTMDMTRMGKTSVVFWTERTEKMGAVPQGKQSVVDAIAKIVKQEIGEKWVNGALRIAKIESSYNCNATGPRTKHGNAKGVFQMLDSSARALGYDPKKMHDCDQGIRAGVAHMKECIASGVKTDRDMAACHVAGWRGWNIKLARRSERYKQQYIRLARA